MKSTVLEPPASAAAGQPVTTRLAVRSILVPTDFSPMSYRALNYAVELAGTLGSQITLLHVVEPLPVFDQTYYTTILDQKQAMEQGRRLIEKLPEQAHLPMDVFLPPLVESGTPFQEITAAALSINADLIVLATHGFSGLKHAIIGSTAERVVRTAPCPVLTVHASDEPNADGWMPRHRSSDGSLEIRRILVAVDFSDCATEALRYAARLAEAFGAGLDLVYVVADKWFAGQPMSLNVAEATAQLREKLCDLANDEVNELVPAFAHIETGKPAQRIVEFAAKHKVDLIVIGTHGVTGVKHLLLGSVAERVVRGAGCPVLVARKGPEKE